MMKKSTFKTFDHVMEKRQVFKRIMLGLTLIAGLVQGAWAADNVSYIERSWDAANKVVSTSKTHDCEEITAAWTEGDGWPTMVSNNATGGWYYVRKNTVIKFSDRPLAVVGEVHLVLSNGCELKCERGLKVQKSDGAVLHIHTQAPESGLLEGAIIAHNRNNNEAGIGAIDKGEPAGDIIFHGGRINAIGGERAAGIGGGNKGHGGHVVVYAGEIFAEGGMNGAGIGGGNGGDGGRGDGTKMLEMYDGYVKATGAVNGAGIGGGWGDSDPNNDKSAKTGHGGNIEIWGGQVYATGGGDAAGIGGGGNPNLSAGPSNYGDVIVHGGYVEALGGPNGAGIGGGHNALFRGQGLLEVHGGTIRATGGSGYAAGIGGGHYGSMHNVVIRGGTVIANGSKGGHGPGIGGNRKSVGFPGRLDIFGGDVQAYGSGSAAGIGAGRQHMVLQVQPTWEGGDFHITIIGGSVQAYADGMGSGIGGGGGSDAIWITILGGKVIASAKDALLSLNMIYGAIAGGELGLNYQDRIDIHSGLRLSKGDDPNKALTPVKASEQYEACHDRDNLYVVIEECGGPVTPHEYDSYDLKDCDNNHHKAHCKYCSKYIEQEHNYVEGVCACGKEENVKPETVSITLYRAKDATNGQYDGGLDLHVVKGQKYTITTCNAPEGLTFMGWMQDPATAPADYEMRDGEFMNNLVDAGKELTPTTAVNLYARYRYRYTDEWTWSDDWNSATVTIRQGDKIILENMAAKVDDNSVAPIAENPDGTFGKSANYAWTKGDDITYNFSDAVSKPVSLALTLSDNADNSALLEQAYGITYQTVTLSGRTLYKDGAWNTLCLPFDVTTASGPLSGDGVVAQVLDAEKSSLSDDGKLTLTFKDAPATIPAGLPFIIKWNAGGADIVSPTFNDVTVTVPQPSSAGFSGGSFVGQFSPFQITDDNINAIILLTDNNTLGYSQSTRTLHSCRAHFEVVRNRVSGARLMTGYSITFGPGAEAESTAISAPATAETVDGNDGWYTLGGQRLGSRPVRKGIYVRQGRKVVIR